MPERKNVIEPFSCCARPRNRLNSWAAVSPAPSQDMITNCGGSSPGTRRCGRGWCGWGPVSWVLPSPISFADGVGVGDAPATRWVAGRLAPHPAKAAAVAPIAAPNRALLLIAIADTHAFAVADWMPAKVRIRDR